MAQKVPFSAPSFGSNAAASSAAGTPACRYEQNNLFDVYSTSVHCPQLVLLNSCMILGCDQKR